jgi:hypothetical protein
MTLDLTLAPMAVASTTRRKIVGYTGPASYVTGGDPVSPQDDLGWGKVYAVLGAIITDGSAIRVGVFDPAASTLVWFIPNTGAEVAGAVDLSTFTGRLEFVGQ